MNWRERRILHGLYYDRQLIDEKKLYRANEIKWFARNLCYIRGKQWRGKDGELKSIKDEDEGYLASKHNTTSAAATRELTYLKESGYISLTKEGSLFRIGVTVKGTDLARELDFPFLGR